MSEWQPIETAPKDGRQFLVFDPHLVVGKSDGIALCIPIPNGFRFNPRIEWTASNGFGIHSWQPTHWMPLPEPPTK